MATDLSAMPAWAQSEALAKGTVSARELLEACLGRIAAHDAGIGAFWHLDQAGARSAADLSDGRRRAGRSCSLFDGICMAVKDNIDVAGLPATAGIGAFRSRVALHDAPAVARLRASGLVLLGKVAMHEGALGATTDTPGFGRCHNPLRHGFTPGGSSGGSAAAVAARFSPLALGTDTMGSVRIPAAYCGVTGLKPTAGLVSRTGVMPLSATLDSVGVLAQTPRDAAFGLELIAGFDEADQQSCRVPPGWRAFAGSKLNMSEQTIGLPRHLGQCDIAAAVMADYENSCRALQSQGARLVEISLADAEPTALRRAALLLAEAEASVVHAGLIDDPDAASASYRAALAFGRATTSGRLVAALAELGWASARARRALDEVDVIFMPTAPQKAFAHGSPAPASQADLTTLANVAGLPAIAVPWSSADGGLPSSMQLIGRRFDEARIVGIAEELIRFSNG